MIFLCSLSCLCLGNGDLENKSGLHPKLQKPEFGLDVNCAGSSSREDLHNGTGVQDDPTVQKTQEVELEVVIEEMPKWNFLRVFFCPKAFFGFLSSSCTLKQSEIKRRLSFLVRSMLCFWCPCFMSDVRHLLFDFPFNSLRFNVLV